MSYSKPPPYSESATAPPPGFTPATNYQPPAPLYPPMPAEQHHQAAPPQPQPQQPQQPPPTVIIHTTTTRPTVGVGNKPSHVQCPSCHASVLTNVRYEANSRTHCWALVLCLFICWPCVCLPYCMESCKSANHYCPNCSAYIGTFEN